MLSSGLTRPRLYAICTAVVALAFAACGRSTTSPTPMPTITAVPTASASAAASAAACAISLGIAYEPDGGNGGSFNGIQYTHFEDNNATLCPSASTPVSPSVVNFSSSVGSVGFAQDASDAVALLRGAGGGFTLAQDIFGATVGILTPVGAPYDLAAQPTPAATAMVSPSPGASPSASASPGAPLLSDGQSVAIVGGSSQAVALVLGAPAAASSPAIVALTSLTNAPPQFGGSIPFSGSTYTLSGIPNVPRGIVRAMTDTSGNTLALVRGPQDLLVFSETFVATGYQFNATADDTSLGSNTTLRGSGALALDPADYTRALVGGTTSGSGNTLTLVTGLPAAINKTATLSLPGSSIRSIVIAPGGDFALVATDVGIVSVGGINGSSMNIVPPFAANPLASMASAPTYTTCNGTTATLTNVASIGISADNKYLVALGSANGVSCPSGRNDAIVAVGYSPTTGGTPSPAPASSASPGPTMFVQNNVIAPPVGADLMFVR